jgi:hypothetical protein
MGIGVDSTGRQRRRGGVNENHVVVDCKIVRLVAEAEKKAWTVVPEASRAMVSASISTGEDCWRAVGAGILGISSLCGVVVGEESVVRVGRETGLCVVELSQKIHLISER